MPLVDYQKLWNFDYGKKYANIPKQLKFLNKFIALELWFTMKNYGTVEKTMVLWNNNGTMEINVVLWKKLWYYNENYETLIELRFTMENTILRKNYVTLVIYSK